MDYKIVLYIIFGILPSLAWLSYYLRKDANPEPKGMILQIFFWGALVTIPVFFTQIGLANLAGILPFPGPLIAIIYWFLVIAPPEELFVYLVVRMRVINSPHLDEPLDIMLYMVVAALGFAALENVLYLFNPTQLTFFDTVNSVVVISLVRFLGATFLHTLCSGFLGYFLALSYCDNKKKIWLTILGAAGAILLHGLYDFSIMILPGNLKLAVPVLILILLGIFMIYAFAELKKLKGICKIEIPAK